LNVSDVLSLLVFLSYSCVKMTRHTNTHSHGDIVIVILLPVLFHKCRYCASQVFNIIQWSSDDCSLQNVSAWFNFSSETERAHSFPIYWF